MPVPESGGSPAQPMLLLAEGFYEYYTRRLAGETAQRAFALGGELGYRRYLFQDVYGEMARLYGPDRLRRGRVVITSVDSGEAAQPAAAIEPAPDSAVARRTESDAAPARSDLAAEDGPGRGGRPAAEPPRPDPAAAAVGEVREADEAGDAPAHTEADGGGGVAGEPTPLAADVAQGRGGETDGTDSYDGIEAAGESGDPGASPDNEAVAAADNVIAADALPRIPADPSTPIDKRHSPMTGPVHRPPAVPAATPGADPPDGGQTPGAGGLNWAAPPLTRPIFNQQVAEITRLHNELAPLRTVYAQQVAQMRASADSELARGLPPNLWQKIRRLGGIAINPRQYVHGREQMRRNNAARGEYLGKLTEYVEAQDSADRAMVRSDEVATFELAVEHEWMGLINAHDPLAIPRADRRGINEAEDWLRRRHALRIGRLTVRRSIAGPALVAGAVLGASAGVAVVTLPVWGPVLAGAGLAAAGAVGRWAGAARAATVNRYQLQNSGFRTQMVDAAQLRRSQLPRYPMDTAGSALASEAVEQYDITTREITRANLARLLGAEAAGAAVAGAGFIAFGLIADGAGHLITEPYAAVPHHGSATPTPHPGHPPTPNHTPTKAPNYGSVNIYASPYDVARQLGSPDPLRTVQNALTQFDAQKGAHYTLVNNAFGARGEQIVDGATRRLLTPAQQTAFNQFMYSLAHTTPAILDP